MNILDNMNHLMMEFASMNLKRLLRGICVLTLLLFLSPIAPAATSEEAAKSYFDEGMDLNKLRRYDDALGKFTQAVQSDLESHKYHQALFLTYIALRRGLQAVQFYKELLKEHPKSAVTHYWLGRFYLESQSMENAALEFREAARLAPKDEHAVISLGHVYLRMGKDPEALKAYLQANRLVPHVAAVHAGLGTIYYHRKDDLKAGKEYEEALKSDPSLTEARYNLSLIYERKGELSKAMKEWQTLLDQDPNESQARERLARAYYRTEQYDEAVREYSTLSQVRQSSPEVFFALGEAQIMLAASLADSDDKNQLRNLAIQAFQRTLELDPANAQARKYLDRLKSKEPTSRGK
ncbi:MAG: tetratricopeptide repeat protein [Nitrospirae bacterium]|nr:tetratricopeptide repeat protein [Nitrospirota bacterium]